MFVAGEERRDRARAATGLLDEVLIAQSQIGFSSAQSPVVNDRIVSIILISH
jgi:hypothetical protein